MLALPRQPPGAYSHKHSQRVGRWHVSTYVRRRSVSVDAVSAAHLGTTFNPRTAVSLTSANPVHGERFSCEAPVVLRPHQQVGGGPEHCHRRRLRLVL